MPPAETSQRTRRSIAVRMLLTFIGVVALMTFADVYLIGEVRRIGRGAEELYVPFTVSNAALEARRTESSLRNTILFVVVSRDPVARSALPEQVKTLEAQLAAELAAVRNGTSGDLRPIEDAESSLRQLVKVRRRLVELVDHDRYDDARQVILEEGTPLHERLVGQLDAIVDAARKRAAALAAEAKLRTDRTVATLWRWLLGVSALCLGAGGAVTLLVFKRLERDDLERRRMDEQFRLAIEASPTGMLLTDRAGTIVLVNRESELLFGRSRDELLGLKVDALVPDSARGEHAGLRDSFFRNLSKRSMGRVGREVKARRADGTEFPAEIALTPISAVDGPLVLCSVVDVTERRRAAERIEASMREKETLLQEIHHRVKNNLQVISSLLGLQARTMNDPESAAALEESQSRVHSIALVHEALYQKGDLGRIEIGGYLESLCRHIQHSMSPDGTSIRIEVRAPGVHLGVDRAIPCGLVVNELVTNAFKHAFKGRSTGLLEVILEPVGETRARLTVRDDGVGLPADVDVDRATRIGLRLVTTLAAQLQGQLEVHRGQGTRFDLEFALRA